MKNMKMNIWSVVIAALVTCAASVPLMAQEQGVEARPDNLPWLNGNTGDARWDKDGEGTEVSVDDGWMFSKIFKPEDGEHFVVYGATKAIFNDGQGTYVDVGYDPSAFTVRRAIDVHVQQDRVRIMVRLSGTAAMFPFYAQGNLGGGNGGEGGDGGAHWAVKSTNEIPVIQLEICGAGEADNAIPVDGTGNLFVTVRGGGDAKYNIDLSFVAAEPAGALQEVDGYIAKLRAIEDGQTVEVPLAGIESGQVKIVAVETTNAAQSNEIGLMIFTTSIVLHGRPKDAPDGRVEGSDRFLLRDGEIVEFRAALSLRPEVFLPIATEHAIKNKFKWTLDPIAGVEGANWVPQPKWPGSDIHAQGIGRVGSYIKIALKRLPARNQDFGPKKLTLDIVGHGYQMDTVLRLFFNRTSQSHPLAKVAGSPCRNTDNWYYYWSMEGNPGVCEYSRVPSEESYVVFTTANVLGIWTGQHIAISRKAAIEAFEPYQFPEGAGGPRADWVAFRIEIETGPDLVNATHAHEATHRLVNDNQLSGGDRIPNAWETQIPGMRADVPDSFGNRFNVSRESAASRDEEFYCVLGTAFSPFGRFVEGGAEPAQEAYHGVKPVKAALENDWSDRGFNWNHDAAAE